MNFVALWFSNGHANPFLSKFIHSLIETDLCKGNCCSSPFHILTSNACFVFEEEKKIKRKQPTWPRHQKIYELERKLGSFYQRGCETEKSNPPRNRMLIHTSQAECVFCKVLCFACLEPIILKTTLPPTPLRSIRTGVQLQCCEI